MRNNLNKPLKNQHLLKNNSGKDIKINPLVTIILKNPLTKLKVFVTAKNQSVLNFIVNVSQKVIKYKFRFNMWK